MIWANVIVLAVIQGVTEFLPVSSSGHLLIAKELLGLESPGVRLEVVLHLGTMLAVLAYYRRRLAALLAGMARGERTAWGTAGLLLLSMVPAALFWWVCGERLDALFADTRLAATVAAAMLWVTGLLLLSIGLARRADGETVSPAQAWWIGCLQAVAILPGISRSGSTITVARHLGLRPDKAAEFSFLMSVPILVAGAAVDFLRGRSAADPGVLGAAHYIVGAAIAAGVGYVAIGMLVRWLCRGRYRVFAVYCFAAGTVALLWLQLAR